jgi:hypothetical protein
MYFEISSAFTQNFTTLQKGYSLDKILPNFDNLLIKIRLGLFSVLNCKRCNLCIVQMQVMITKLIALTKRSLKGYCKASSFKAKKG